MVLHDICAPLIADFFFFCCESDFVLLVSVDTQADAIVAFNSTSRYLDDLFEH